MTLGSVLLAAGPANAQNPTTPGAIPNPGSYQGSLELQRQEDQRNREQREQQQQQYQPQPQYGSQPRYGAPAAPAVRGGGYVPKVMPDFAATDVAMAAMSSGDYVKADRILRPLVARGDMVAEYLFGVMHERGMGRPANYVLARQLFMKSSAQGFAAAMMNLGGLYAEGQGGPADRVQAYRWFTLAIPRLNDQASLRQDAVALRKHLLPKMTSAQVAQAEALARQSNVPFF